MVKPVRWLRTAVLVGPWCLGLSAGCGLVPQGQLDECRKRSQALLSENARLKDLTVSLRSQNDDLTTRAVADARRLRLQEEAVQRLETSVEAYQEERDQLSSAFERLKGQIQSSAGAGPLSSRLSERLREFARTRPGCEFDAPSGVIAFATAELFQPGTDRLQPGASALLQAYAEILADPEARALRLSVAGPAEDNSVRRVSAESDPALGRARAARVRDWLATEVRLDAEQVRVAEVEATPALARWIEVRMRPPPEAPARARIP
jgi:flagellar motor protein MotB